MWLGIIVFSTDIRAKFYYRNLFCFTFVRLEGKYVCVPCRQEEICPLKLRLKLVRRARVLECDFQEGGCMITGLNF